MFVVCAQLSVYVAFGINHIDQRPVVVAGSVADCGLDARRDLSVVIFLCHIGLWYAQVVVGIGLSLAHNFELIRVANELPLAIVGCLRTATDEFIISVFLVEAVLGFKTHVVP